MRIKDRRRGTGPQVASKFNRGDSWVALDGEHSECPGRQAVVGIGCRPDGAEGLLMRCEQCLQSYVLIPNS